jgi:hypothetical protein
MEADAALPGANGVEAGDIEAEDTVVISPANAIDQKEHMSIILRCFARIELGQLAQLSATQLLASAHKPNSPHQSSTPLAVTCIELLYGPTP